MICNNNNAGKSSTFALNNYTIICIFSNVTNFENISNFFIRYNVFAAAKVAFMMKKVNRTVGDHGVGVARAARPLMTTIHQAVL